MRALHVRAAGCALPAGLSVAGQGARRPATYGFASITWCKASTLWTLRQGAWTPVYTHVRGVLTLSLWSWKGTLHVAPDKQCPVSNYLQRHHEQTRCNRQTIARALSLAGRALASRYLCPCVTHVGSLSICYTHTDTQGWEGYLQITDCFLTDCNHCETLRRVTDSNIRMAPESEVKSHLVWLNSFISWLSGCVFHY